MGCHNCSTEGGLFVGCDDLSVRSVASIVYIHDTTVLPKGVYLWGDDLSVRQLSIVT